MATSDRSLGGFSCDAISPSGNNPYYQIINPSGNPGFQQIAPEALVCSSTTPYYALTGSSGIGSGSSLTIDPYTIFPVALPDQDLTNSRVLNVGPYGACSIPLSGNAGFGVSAIQYGVGESFFVTGNAPNINPPTGPPTVPSLAAPATGDTIPIIFDTLNISGTEPIAFLLAYGTSSTYNPSWTVLPTLPVIGSPTQRVANATGLIASTTYYFVSIAQNSAGSEQSVVSPGYITQPGEAAAPSGPPTVPILVNATPSSLTIQFDIAGITGNPVPHYFVAYGTTTTPVTNAPTPVLYQGTLYRTTVTGLASSVGYYFTASATNGKPPDQTSAVAGPFVTAGSNAPSKAPTAPVVSGLTPPTVTTITITTDITGITGTPTPTYTSLWGLTPDTITNPGSIMTVSGNTATGTVSALTSATIYYFVVIASNGVAPNQRSLASGPITTAGGSTPPNLPPSVPVVEIPPTPTSIAIQFDVTGVTGSPSPIFNVLWGTTTSPTTSVNCLLIAGSIYGTTITGLTPATPYYFKSVATNGIAPAQVSAVSPAISTAPSGGTAPNQPPSVPAVFGTPTSTSITVQFDSTGVTGQPPPAFSVLYGTTTSPIISIPALIVGSGPLYQATVTGLLPNTPYYFKSVAGNGVLPDQTSVASAAIPTAAGSSAPSQPPTAPVVSVSTPPTTSQITVTTDITGITGTPTPYYTVNYGFTPDQAVNQGGLMTVLGNTATCTVSGLNSATIYFFKAYAINGVSPYQQSLASSGIPTAGGTSAPSGPPSQPYALVDSPPTSTTISVQFDIQGVSGNPSPQIKVLYGTTTSPITQAPTPVLKPGTGSVYIATVLGLTPSTPYYFQAVAYNGIAPDQLSPLSNPIPTAGGGGGTAPNQPPSVPAVFGTPTSSSITVQFDSTGVTGNPPPAFSVLWGTTTSPTTFASATIVGSGPLYQATITGLAPNTPYYFKSVAGNGVLPNQTSAASAAIPTAAGPPSSTVLKNQQLITFLIRSVIEKTWQINTSGNVDVGSMYLTGGNAGNIQGATPSPSGYLPTPATSIANMLAWKASGATAGHLGSTPLMISMGGATGTLAYMMPTTVSAIQLCNSIWHTLLGATAAPNPLFWQSTEWSVPATPTALYFDGIDLDWENQLNGDIALAFVTQWVVNKGLYEGTVGKKYLNMAPQTPNTWYAADSGTPYTNGGANIPWVGSQSALSTLAPTFLASAALLAPAQLQHFDNVFLQLYNQAGLYMTQPPGSQTYNPLFTAQVAQWAYLVMKARRAGGSTVLTMGFASIDAPQIWVPGPNNDGSILNIALPLINAQVSAQLVTEGGAPCLTNDWCGGFGMWNSPTANSPSSEVFSATSQVTRANLSGQYMPLYMSATYPSPSPGWSSLPTLDLRP